MADAGKILNQILGLIDKDVKKIKRVYKDKQLDPADALTLTRYASTLSDIAHVKEKETEKAKKELSKLPTDKLIEEYLKEKKQ